MISPCVVQPPSDLTLDFNVVCVWGESEIQMLRSAGPFLGTAAPGELPASLLQQAHPSSL